MSTVEPIKNISDLRKIEKLLAKNMRDLILFDLGINCGLIISDILSLDIKNVKNKNNIELFEKKTGKYKKFPLNSKMITLLYDYVKNKDENEPLFKTVYNNRMDRITAYRILKQACSCLNINIKVGTHTLRKTFGYHFYKKFDDIVLLQKIFNHSTPNTTLRYIGLEQEEIDEKYMQFIL
ncbi:MAG: tyrosine-type recombinase/integrase [bacterium]|nr:tyrosine-type recombinase/integrase [bacterium]